MKQKVALVLSGGGARGIAHIGVIEELEKQGFDIASVSGTSMGALVGGVYATGKLEELKNWLYDLDKMKIFNLVDFTLSAHGLIKGDKVLNKIKEFVSDVNIENLRIPYAAVAADIINSKEVVFTKGSMFDAIRASIAIPTVLTPVKTKDGLLVDGGAINNIPISHVKRMPDDILVVVDVNANIPVFKPTITKKDDDSKQSIYQKKMHDFYHHLQNFFPKSHEEKLGYFNVINKTMALVAYQIAQISLEHYSPEILVNISRDSCGIFDFFKAEEMVEIGRHAAIESIKEYQKTK